jgi:hypothetical protein
VAFNSKPKTALVRFAILSARADLKVVSKVFYEGDHGLALVVKYGVKLVALALLTQIIGKCLSP